MVDTVDATTSAATKSLVIEGRVTELVDVAHLASSALDVPSLPELTFFDHIPDDFTNGHQELVFATSGSSNGVLR